MNPGNYEDRIVQFMTEIWHKKQPVDWALLEIEEHKAVTDIEKALYLEAKMTALYAQEGKIEKLVPLAEEAINLNSESVMALMFLSSWEFENKNTEEGIRKLMLIIDVFPDATWVYLHIVRVLVTLRDYRKACQYIKLITKKSLRNLYFVTICLIRPSFWVLLFIFSLWIYLNGPGWLFFIIFIPFVSLYALSVFLKERALYYRYSIWIVFLFLLMVFIPYLDKFLK